jgi:hypothetical protein
LDEDAKYQIGHTSTRVKVLAALEAGFKLLTDLELKNSLPELVEDSANINNLNDLPAQSQTKGPVSGRM